MVAGIAALFLTGSGTLAAQPSPPEEQAQLAAIDAQITASQTETGTLELARADIARGDRLHALTVLESYLLNHRNSIPVRVEYAQVLCRLDDPLAGRYEMAKLATQGLDAQTATKLRAACGITPDQALSEYKAK